MKEIKFLMLIFFIHIGIGKAQVTTFGDNSPEEFEFLPYSGARILQGVRVDMGMEKYCIVYSKPPKGTVPDTVYVQQYIKKGENWELMLKDTRVSNETVFMWSRRGGFFTDKDKNGIAYCAFSEENLDSEKRLLVGYIILYKGEMLIIEETLDGKISKSANYNKLPKKARIDIEEAFSKLDKWK